jgi:hypothetical protein
MTSKCSKQRPHAAHESQTAKRPGTAYRALASALVVAAIISIGCFWITQARFLGFANYIVFGGGGASTRDVVVSCNTYLDNASVRSSLVKATASAIAGGYVESAVREGFVRVVGSVHDS